MAPIVIIGTGLAGYAVARELRRTGYTGSLSMVTSDDGGFYSKPMLSNACASGKSADDLVLNRAEDMAETLKAEIITHARVEAIDRLQHEIELSPSSGGGGGGKISSGRLSYRKLVLACGARPLRLPLIGARASEVLSVNSRHDYAVFRQALARWPSPARVAILGGGLIGCEFANDLITAGHEVHVIDMAPWPLGRLVPQAVGDALRQTLAMAGVSWHLGRTVAEVGGLDSGQVVPGSPSPFLLQLDDASLIECDVVLSAVGLVPDTALARAAGLEVNRGVVVNGLLTTSDPSIYAIGDCAEVQGVVRPYVLPITYGAKALALSLTWTPTEVIYPAMPVAVKTPALPLVVCPPDPGAVGAWQVERMDHPGEEGALAGAALRARFISPEGKLQGFALSGSACAEKQGLMRTLSE